MKSVFFKIKKKTKIFILAPVIRGKKGQHKSVINQIQKQGFLRIRIDGEVYKVDDKIELDKTLNNWFFDYDIVGSLSSSSGNIIKVKKIFKR